MRRMTYTMNSKMKQGDVWLADVLFKGKRQTKQRPVIIAPVTSQQPRNQFDVVLEYWKEAGLLKPSVARTSKITSVHGSELKRHLGVLHSYDLERILKMCKNLF